VHGSCWVLLCGHVARGTGGLGMFRGRESIGRKLTCDCCHFGLTEAWMVLVVMEQIPQILLQQFKEVDGKPEVGSRNFLKIASYLQYTKMPQKKMII
jgi:hypothetical protein